MLQLSYVVDRGGRVVAVGGDWDRFARSNGAPNLSQSSIVGRPLREFIADRTVREVYEAILAHARRQGPVRFQYRCDAAAFRRDFTMEVRKCGEDAVEFVSTLVGETPRPPIALFSPSSQSPQGYIRMCSWCHAIADRSGQWLPLEQAIVTLDVLKRRAAVAVTHGICPPCADAMVRTVGARTTANGHCA